MHAVSEHIDIEPYSGDADEWNGFVDRSINATFLHHRDYMEHHDDPFDDVSSIVRYKDDVIALFPANVTAHGSVIESHGGLTYGGILIDEQMTTAKMLSAFGALRGHYKDRGADVLYYKTIPTIYHRQPASGDRYALWSHGAELYRRDVTSVIPPHGVDETDSRARSIANARESVTVYTTTSPSALRDYWSIVEENLADRHDTEPTHTLDEIEYLFDRFSGHIELWAALDDEDGEMIAGTLVYNTDRVAHAQYIASTERGRELNALDWVFHCVAEWETVTGDRPRFFDFGISTEDEGRSLNEGLVFYKESFGARPVVHDFYEVVL